MRTSAASPKHSKEEKSCWFDQDYRDFDTKDNTKTPGADHNIEALLLFGPKTIPVTMKLNLTDQSRGSCQSNVVFDDNLSKNLIENLNSFSGD